MNTAETLQNILKNNYTGDYASDSQRGVYSVCSAHPEVIKAAMHAAQNRNYPLVIESTSNQVDQYGGYTGMKPKDFMNYIAQLAQQQNFPTERLLLGGDHLGPNTWQKESGESAMQKAQVLVAEYVRAGYRKIHLDASMACAGDPTNPHGAIPDELVAERAAQRCWAAEQAWQENHQAAGPPIYVIGTEVPTPGGQKAGDEEETVEPTSPEAARQTWENAQKAFVQKGLEGAWQRVIAMVVQPGVEFGDESVCGYQPHLAQKLSRLSPELRLVFEAHSTDYQSPEALRNLTRDHFAILKVGPWLTYAYREALFSLSRIAEEMQTYKLLPNTSENFRSKVLAYLQAHPQYWQNYYTGTKSEIAYKCLYSLSDRIRYYWPQKEMAEYTQELLAAFGKTPLPYSLVSQYFPNLAIHALEPHERRAERLIPMHIQASVLSHYEVACTA